MNVYHYSLESISESDRVFFMDMLSYLSEYVKEIHRNGTSVDILYEGTDEASVRNSVENLAAMINVRLKKADDKVRIKTLEDHTDAPVLNTADIFEDMQKQKIITPVSSGAYAYSGIFLKVFRYFCRKIEEQADVLFPDTKKTDLEVPVLTPVSDYEEGKYFETFPHHIMFQTTMKNDLNVIDRFARNGAKDKDIFNEIKTPENVLRTAACVPVYPSLRNSELQDQAPVCVKVSGKCFRNEGANVTELARLNEFYMKEYVFVGTPQQAKEYIEKASALWKFWIDTFGLNCRIDTANDSFFASNYKKLRLFQIMGDSKREFKLLIPGSGSYISCSSANFHRTHFTKVYNIRTAGSGAYCHSSCFAFGIERLAYALLSQKGLDVSKWDESTKNELSRYIEL